VVSLEKLVKGLCTIKQEEVEFRGLGNVLVGCGKRESVLNKGVCGKKGDHG